MLDQRINQKFREPRENRIENRRQLSDRPPPVQVARFLQVQKKIKARGNEWDKDSPVWGNRQYLSNIYNEMKRKYLKEQQRFSYVFVYDWSEPGDVEVVVEDIESLELDWVDEYSDQQIDWKQNRDEQHHGANRYMFSNFNLRHRLCCCGGTLRFKVFPVLEPIFRFHWQHGHRENRLVGVWNQIFDVEMTNDVQMTNVL